MKLRLLGLLLWLFGITAMYADNATIVIKQKGGVETVLKLSTHPVITFEGDVMVITNDVTSFTIPLADIDDYTVEEEPTGISRVTVNPQFANGRVVFDNLAVGVPVYVYAMDGRIISLQSADASGKAEVSLDGLPKGAYIISSGNIKLKVINK